MSKLIFLSYGEKYGVVYQCNLLFDVRILTNPYYIDELKNLTGLDNRVYDFVIKDNFTKKYLKKIIKVIDYYLFYYVSKAMLYDEDIVIGVKCSGGRHRSVAVCEYLKKYYDQNYEVTTIHKDVDHEIS